MSDWLRDCAIDRAVWIGDGGDPSDIRYENREELVEALAAGEFCGDCCTFVNMVNYLRDGSNGVFQGVRGVCESPFARYCCGPVIAISNGLPFPARGQWIVLVEDKWYGLTSDGVQVKGLDEWIDYSKQKLANAALDANDRLAALVATSSWTARSMFAFADPTDAETMKESAAILKLACEIYQAKAVAAVNAKHTYNTYIRYI